MIFRPLRHNFWLSFLLFSCILVVYGTMSTNGPIGIAQGSGSIDAALKLLSLSDELQRKCSSDENLQLSSAMPFVTISYAQTLDGSIAPLNRTRLDISSKTSFRLLHSLRARHDGVLIGINTVIADQPRLNVRDPLPGINVPTIQPRPIVIDSELRILHIDELRLERPVVCSCLLDGPGGIAVETKWVDTRIKLEAIGGTLVACKREPHSGQCDLRDCLSVLKSKLDMKSILVEGGAGIIQSVIESNLANQVILTVRPCFFGGYRIMTRQLPGPAQLEDVKVASIGGDVVMHGVIRHSHSVSNDAGQEFVNVRENVVFVS